MNRLNAYLAFVALVCSSNVAGAKEPQKKIAVLEVQLSGADENLGRMLSEVIATEAARLSGSHVVSPADILAMIGFEEQRQLLGCEDGVSCFAEIGGALGVDVLIVSSLGRINESHVINIKLVDLKSVEVLSRVSKIVAGDPAQIFEVARASMPTVLRPVVFGTQELVAVPAELAAPAIAPGVTTTPDFISSFWASNWPKWGIVGLGAACLVTAGTLEIAAKLEHDAAWDTVVVDGQSLHSLESPSHADSARTLSRTAVGLTVAGSLIAAAGATWLLAPQLFENPVSVTTAVSSDASGLIISGRF